MIIPGILGGIHDCFHNGDLINAVKTFVYSDMPLNEEAVLKIKNLYEAEINVTGYSLKKLNCLDINAAGRDLEVRLASAIAICHPECNVGLTRATKDGGGDILIEQDGELSVIDTKGARSERKIPENLEICLEGLDWMLYVIPSKRANAGSRLEPGKRVRILGLNRLVTNFCNTSLEDLYPYETDMYINKIHDKLADLTN